MNRKIYLTLVFLAIVNLCFCQNSGKGKTNFKFLYVVSFQNKPPVTTGNAFIAPSGIDSMYASPRYQDIYGLFKADQIAHIRVKPAAELLTLNKLLNIYGIGEKYRKVAVKLDDDILDHPETILISKSQIEKVKLIKYGNGHYIHIILNGYYEYRKKYPLNGDFVD